MGRPWAWRRQGGQPARPGRKGPGGDGAGRVILLLGSMAGALLLFLTWFATLALIAEDTAMRQSAAQSRAMAAARAARDALPRALEPAQRALAALQSRALAQARFAQGEVDAIEKNLLAAVHHGQDGLRAVAVSDANGLLIWQPQPGALPASLGGSGLFLVHRQGRMAPLLTALAAGGWCSRRRYPARPGRWGGAALEGWRWR